jgi:hypothetical protein
LLLAQFEPSGYLQQITKSQSRLDIGSKEHSRSVGAGKISPVAADVGRKNTSAIHTGINLSEVYDPLWSNAVNFLNLIDAANLLQRDINSAGIGQLVEAEGTLELMDLSLVKDILGAPATLDQLSATWKQSHPDQHDSMMDSIRAAQHFPYSIQIYLVEETTKVWGNLKPEAMTTSAADLMLKYGVILDGKWKVVGIKDAVAKDTPTKPRPPLFKEELILNSTLYAQFYLNTAPLMRGFLGRPVGFHGMTPLLIFRVVGGQAA